MYIAVFYSWQEVDNFISQLPEINWLAATEFCDQDVTVDFLENNITKRNLRIGNGGKKYSTMSIRDSCAPKKQNV